MAFAPPSAREWVTFPDPADADHEIRADLTFLLSNWSCIWGRGCPGIAADPIAGCCTHGAFFSDKADQKRVAKAAKELTKSDWQRYGQRPLAEQDELEDEPAWRTATQDGACIYLNGPDFAAGPGCALHGLALRTGRHPLELKPDVCWQVPVSRKIEEHADGTRTTTLTEFSRRSWGEGGADLHWWCTESQEAFVAPDPMFVSYGPELTALIGAPAYDELARLCRGRLTGTRLLLPLV
jgi:hypothetical protein